MFIHGMKSDRFAFTLPVWVTWRRFGKGKGKGKDRKVSEEQFVPIRFWCLLSPPFLYFCLGAQKVQGHQDHVKSETKVQRYKTQCHMISKINYLELRIVYTLSDGHKSNWNFRRHALPPSSSSEVSNYLVGPTTWRPIFTLGTICNKGPNRKYVHLHISLGGGGRERFETTDNSKILVFAF